MKAKFMTFNIQHCRDYVKRVIDIDLMTRTIKKCNPDIIGLNEVYGEYEDKPSQAQVIANKLGYHYYYGKSIIYKGIPYGNAIISRYKLNNVEVVKIPDPIRNTDEPYESRTIIKAELDNFVVLISHFGLVKSEQENAVQTVTNLINKINKPIILMGDFNMDPNDSTLKPIYNLLNNTLEDNIFTYPSINPTRKIDYIFASKDIRVLDAQIPNLVASDHLPHTAILDFKIKEFIQFNQ